MSKYERARPEKPQPKSAYAGQAVWDIAFKPLDSALFVVMFQGVILSDESFGDFYENEGGIFSVSNDEDQQFWRTVHAALIKEDATISYYKPVLNRFFRSYKYKHEFVGRDKAKILKGIYPGVHDDPAEYIFVSDEMDAHTEESVRLAVTFLEHVSSHDYPYSFMTPLLENYQQILWISRSTLYLLTRNNYFSREEIKHRLSRAIQPFGLTLPKYDWVIAQQ